MPSALPAFMIQRVNYVNPDGSHRIGQHALGLIIAVVVMAASALTISLTLRPMLVTGSLAPVRLRARLIWWPW